MKKIILTPEWSITTDNVCSTLRYEKGTGRFSEKSGEEIISKREFYYPNVKAALQSYVVKDIEACTTIHEILDKLEILRRRIEGMGIIEEKPIKAIKSILQRTKK